MGRMTCFMLSTVIMLVAAMFVGQSECMPDNEGVDNTPFIFRGVDNTPLIVSIEPNEPMVFRDLAQLYEWLTAREQSEELTERQAGVFNTMKCVEKIERVMTEREKIATQLETLVKDPTANLNKIVELILNLNDINTKLDELTDNWEALKEEGKLRSFNELNQRITELDAWKTETEKKIKEICKKAKVLNYNGEPIGVVDENGKVVLRSECGYRSASFDGKRLTLVDENGNDLLGEVIGCNCDGAGPSGNN